MTTTTKSEIIAYSFLASPEDANRKHVYCHRGILAFSPFIGEMAGTTICRFTYSSEAAWDRDIRSKVETVDGTAVFSEFADWCRARRAEAGGSTANPNPTPTAMHEAWWQMMGATVVRHEEYDEYQAIYGAKLAELIEPLFA